ncbi:uncharacterized protein CIMG_08270 [Coccidioides immitis RS]|uniref:Fungal-type protein kinase domain-containing protein n=1 Tax=Coccidioides immitis (strain RS) TaxID=246410 RepID=A0A0E1RVA1_COCIM|nr:uncharacterized protein CIMG_08270 [Coccidioides immitis RS]EAS29524.2 hypothetical protein CIMG_08270 [Coccidioides immitis RS]
MAVPSLNYLPAAFHAAILWLAEDAFLPDSGYPYTSPSYNKGESLARMCYKNRTSLYKKVGRMKATYKSHVFPRLGQALQLIAKRKSLSQTTGNILLHQDILEKTIIITNPENADGNSSMLIGLNLAKEIMQRAKIHGN